MRNVAFSGGNAVGQLGPVSDVVLFFDCINHFAADEQPNVDWSVLTDKLYRRYIDTNHLDQARARMVDLKEVFAKTPSSAVEWNSAMAGDRSKSILDPSGSTLADVFAKYFEHFEWCAASSMAFHETWGSQVPIRTIISDMPQMLVDSDRPLAQHDALSPDDPPFWLRRES